MTTTASRQAERDHRAAAPPGGSASRWQARLARSDSGLRALFASPSFVLGLSLLCLFTVLAFIRPLLLETVWSQSPGIYDPETGFDLRVAPHPSPPSARHWLGTGPLGHDVFSMLLLAIPPALIVGLTVAATVLVTSTASAATSASWPGPIDAVLSHLADALLLVPAPVVMIAIGWGFPMLLSPFEFGLLYGLIFGPGAAAIVLRTSALSVMQKPFIAAARVAGASRLRIIGSHLLPHLLPHAAVQMLLSVTGAIVALGFAEFLGGAETRIGLGSMIYKGMTYQVAIMSDIAWSLLLSGALTISLFCAAFYLLGMGLSQVADPTLRGQR